MREISERGVYEREREDRREGVCERERDKLERGCKREKNMSERECAKEREREGVREKKRERV